jgi:DNA-binding response OmpR family regulator
MPEEYPTLDYPSHFPQSAPMPADLAILPQTQPAPVPVPKQHTVLIIDDDDTLSNVLSHRLKQQGFQAVAARCGKLGLSKAKAQPPSAIILDLGLPDVHGLSVCEQLTESPETCSVPIMVLSGTDEADIVRRCRAAGGHYFLRKPYDPNALLVLLEQAIRETDASPLLPKRSGL